MHRPRHAFTLIEALVAIAILAVLIGLLVPASIAAHRFAIRTACASNLRQVGIAALSYAADNDEVLPAVKNYGDEDPRTSPAWFHRLPDYAGSRTVRGVSVFQCAGFHWHGAKVFTNATPKSFKMNAAIAADGRPRHYQLGRAEDEGDVALFVDAQAGETGMGQWGDLLPTAVDDSRHHGVVNVLYLDGHTLGVVTAPKAKAKDRWRDAIRWTSVTW